MATKTSHRRAARRTARVMERAQLTEPTGYATFGPPDSVGRYATFGLPYAARAAR